MEEISVSLVSELVVELLLKDYCLCLHVCAHVGIGKREKGIFHS